VIPFTVSIGVATRAPGEHDLEAILNRADDALYKAKKAGRNRVEVETGS
jgi:diguanylate cyclase (GGDEF)-like protein